MRSFRLPVVVLAVASTLLLVACAERESGSPVAGATTTSDEPPTTSSAPETTTSSPGGSRPTSFDMAAVDVCQLVSQLPLQTFGLDGDRPPVGGDSSIFPGSKDCYAGGIQANLGLTLIAVVDEGAADFAGSANAESSETEVAGYQVFVLKPQDPSGCFGAVDVNDGQLLFINYGMSIPDTEPITPQDQLCQVVPDIAAAALAVLGG